MIKKQHKYCDFFQLKFIQLRCNFINLLINFFIGVNMLHETISLPVRYLDKGVKNNCAKPSLTMYILDNYEEFSAERKRPLVLICPGGGYEFLSDREAEPVAIKMNALGFHAAVLRYSLAPMDFPAALLDLCEAVALCRSRAAEWNVDTEKIVVAGFSAGGHLAASLGVYWNSPLIQKYLPLSASDVRPNALMLGYPVIKSGDFSHESSIKNVLGGATEFTEADVSLERLVSKDTPRTFMWHTNEDNCVPLENSLEFAHALRRASVPFEYHIFEKGGHGLSLATKETAWSNGVGDEPTCATWPELFARFIVDMFGN